MPPQKMTASNLHMYNLAHEMILDHLSPCAQFANRSMSELFGHVFSRCVFLSLLWKLTNQAGVLSNSLVFFSLSRSPVTL